MLFNIKGMFLKDILRDSQLQPKNAIYTKGVLKDIFFILLMCKDHKFYFFCVNVNSILKLGILYIVKRTFPKFCRSTRFGAESNGVARDWKE